MPRWRMWKWQRQGSVGYGPVGHVILVTKAGVVSCQVSCVFLNGNSTWAEATNLAGHAIEIFSSHCINQDGEVVEDEEVRDTRTHQPFHNS